MRLLITLAVLLTACQPPGPAVEDPTPEERAIPVAVEAARRGTVADPVQATGTVAPNQQVTVASEGSGRVLEVLVGLGSSVTKGAALARLDSAVQRAQLDQARANLRGAEAQLALAQDAFGRSEQLLDQGAQSASSHLQSDASLAGAQSAVDAARAAVTLAERQVSDTTIRAPWSGTVASVGLSEGALIAPGTPAFKLVSLDPVRIDVGLPAREIGLVQPGQLVRVTLPTAPGPAREAQVARVGPEADARSRTFPVEIELANPAGDLRSGMVARAAIVVGEREGVTLVPEAAVVAARPPVVFVIDGDRAHKREVELGRSQSGLIEVIGGVEPGDLVATLGRQHLSDGALVTRYDLAAEQPDAKAEAPAPPPE